MCKGCNRWHNYFRGYNDGLDDRGKGKKTEGHIRYMRKAKLHHKKHPDFFYHLGYGDGHDCKFRRQEKDITNYK